MTSSFAERFAAVRAVRGPLVLGADPHAQVLAAWGLTDDADGLERFTDIVLAAAAGTVGLVKPQSAFYERHGWRGVRALSRLAAEARAAGLLVIMDVKRGDVGSTSDAYAQAYLGEDAPLRADAVTVHPYLGFGALGEFTRRADESGSCVLVVVRSSNPEGRALQSAVSGSLLAEIGAVNKRLAPGRLGPVGAVVGPSPAAQSPAAQSPAAHSPAAPSPAEPSLDLAGAHGLLLAPGVGAQGASPADVAATFAACPDRVMPSASRSLLAAGPDPRALGAAAARLNEEFRARL